MDKREREERERDAIARGARDECDHWQRLGKRRPNQEEMERQWKQAHTNEQTRKERKG